MARLQPDDPLVDPALSGAALPAVRRRGWRAAVRVGLALLRLWRARARQRRALARLDDRLLRDIGVTRGEAAREIQKAFWR